MTTINDVMSKTEYGMEEEVFSKFSSDHAKQLLPWSTLLKNQVIVPKTAI